MFRNIMIVIVSFISLSGTIVGNEKELPKSENIKNVKPIVLDELINEALQNNPEIKAFNERWEASKMRIPQAGTWKDPQLNFNIINLPAKNFDFNLDPMTGKQFLFTQQIPFPGKTSLEKKVAAEDEEVFGELFNDKKNEIIKKVKEAYYNLYLIDKSIEITEKNKSLLESFIKIVSSKYEVGRGIQHDVLKVQVELSKIMKKLITLRQNRKSVSARINTLGSTEKRNRRY